MQEDPTAQNGNNGGGNASGSDDDLSDLEAQGDFVVVDTASFNRMRRQEAIAAEVVETTRIRDRNDLVEEAIADGKISPSRRDHYRARYDSDQEATVRLLARLQPNTVPLVERGVDAPTDEVDDTAYPTQWVPEVAARQGRPQSRVHGED
jgi:hypothetical protein